MSAAADPNTVDTPVLSLSDDHAQGISKGALAIFFGVSAVYIGYRLWDLTGASLWSDEIFALRIARVPWGELLPTLADDKTTPPLFYVILKLWISVGGESLLWLKLLPFLVSVINLVPFYFLCRELRMSGLAMNLALALMAPNSFLINYSQEVRMYCMLLLFTTVSIWAFVRYVNRPLNARANVALLFGANLLLVYTHYFGWLVVGVEAIFLLWLSPRRVIPLIAPAVGLVLLFVPWALMVARVAVSETVPFHNILWIERPGRQAIWWLFLLMTGQADFWRSSSVRYLLFLGPPAFWIYLRVRKRDRRPENRVLVMLTALILLPTTLVFVVSQIGPNSFWHPRYFIIIFVPFMILVAASIERLRPTIARAAFAIGVIAFSINAGTTPFQDAEFSRVKWQALVSEVITVDRQGAEPVKIYAFEILSHAAVEFYLDAANSPRHSAALVEHSSQISDDSFWLVYGPRREADRSNSPIEVLSRRGYRSETISTYGRKGYEVLLVRFTK